MVSMGYKQSAESIVPGVSTVVEIEGEGTNPAIKGWRNSNSCANRLSSFGARASLGYGKTVCPAATELMVVMPVQYPGTPPVT